MNSVGRGGFDKSAVTAGYTFICWRRHFSPTDSSCNSSWEGLADPMNGQTPQGIPTTDRVIVISS